MSRSRSFRSPSVLGLALLLGATACAKGSGPTTVSPDGSADDGSVEAGPAVEPTSAPEPTTDSDTAAEPVVKNVDAQPGDVTTCPFSGRTFVVKAEHPKVEYEGKSYWICSEKAAEQVRADPAKYLDGFEG